MRWFFLSRRTGSFVALAAALGFIGYAGHLSHAVDVPGLVPRDLADTLFFLVAAAAGIAGWWLAVVLSEIPAPGVGAITGAVVFLVAQMVFGQRLFLWKCYFPYGLAVVMGELLAAGTGWVTGLVCRGLWRDVTADRWRRSSFDLAVVVTVAATVGVVVWVHGATALDLKDRLRVYDETVQVHRVERRRGLAVGPQVRATPQGYVYVRGQDEPGPPPRRPTVLAIQAQTGGSLWTWQPPGEQGYVESLSVEPGGDVWVMCRYLSVRACSFYRLEGETGAVVTSVTVPGVYPVAAEGERLFYVRLEEKQDEEVKEEQEATREVLTCAVVRNGRAEPLWEFRAWREGYQLIGVLTPELVLVRGEEGLWRLDPDTGEVIWRWEGCRPAICLPAWEKNLVLTAEGLNLLALRLDTGELAWGLAAPAGIDQRMAKAVAGGGAAYVGTFHWHGEGPAVFAARLEDGRVEWRSAIERSLFSLPWFVEPVALEGILLVPTTRGSILGLDRGDGRRLFRYRLDADVRLVRGCPGGFEALSSAGTYYRFAVSPL